MNVTVLGTAGRIGTAAFREPARLGTVTEQFRVVQPSVSRLLCPSPTGTSRAPSDHFTWRTSGRSRGSSKGVRDGDPGKEKRVRRPGELEGVGG